MYVRRFLALGAVLLGTACQVPVDAGSTAVELRVVSVAIQPKSVTVLVGDSLQLSASVTMSNSQAAKAVTWTSSDTTVATVSGSGVVRGRAPGSLFVRARSGPQGDSAAVTVATPSPLPVASVTVAPASLTLAVGGTSQLAATLKDASGNALAGRAISWVSGNTQAATVSATGLVTAVAAGSATIAATSEGQSGTATVTVTAPTPPPTAPPGTVTDLVVSAVSDSSVTLAFTEVGDGTGQPASYDIRVATGSSLTWGGGVPSVSQGTCASPVVGTAVGGKRSCTVLGLAASTVYSFELISFRGTLSVNAVFGGLSNVVTGTTAARPSSGPTSGTVYFNSDFEDGTLGDLSVFPGSNGGCTVSTDVARSGTRSAKCVTTSSNAAEAALFYTWGNKPGEPANPALAEANGYYQKFSVMFAPGAFANVYNGGSSSQFKVLLNRSDWHYGYTGAWFMTSWGAQYGPTPPVLKNNGDNCGTVTWTWPYGLQEGVWYDITTWFKRDSTTHTGHAKMWVNGVLMTDTDASLPDWVNTPSPGGYSCLGTDIAADQQELEIGAAYTANTVGPFTVYVDNVEAANFPIGAAATAAAVSARR